MTMNDLIRISLKRAADDTKMTDEQKVELLIKILTAYLTKQLGEGQP